jgi:serpin B
LKAKQLPFNQEFLDIATKNYYASLFSVDFSDKKTGKLMEKWVSENTNGILEGEHKTDSDLILSIINAIYFYDEWKDPFDKRQTKKDTFNSSDGHTISGDFMNKSFSGHPFIKGKGYLSSSLPFKNGASIHFYLPDQGIDVYDLISTPEKVKELLDSHDAATKKQTGNVVFKIPKYDYGSKFLLKDHLISMGMKNAFDGNADFSGITNARKANISEVITRGPYYH